MKGYTRLILVAMLALALTGCAVNDDDGNATTKPGAGTTTGITGTTTGIGTTSGLGAGDVTTGTTGNGIIGSVAETVESAITGTTTPTTIVK